MIDVPRYTAGEEIANSVTHAIGLVAAIAGLAVLTAFATVHGDALHVLGSAVFGTTLILLFTTSTLYHSIYARHLKPLFRALDHSAIFLLIAGTYTPFMLGNLRGPWGWSLLAVIWAVGLGGIALRLCLKGRLHGLVVAFYLAMGWAVVVAIEPMLELVPRGGLLLLAGGGLAYTVGVVFYRWRSLPYSHAIWHGFVLLGSSLHFFAVLGYAIPRTVTG